MFFTDIFLFLTILNVIFLPQILADEVWGCNGFVKSNVGPIDFGKVEVKMFTKQGSLKYETECAPNNGYYFLPLHDKGEYVLKVSSPMGWNFEPSEVAVSVDGTSDSCSLGVDINFVLQGFAVTGQVTSFGEPVGPAGVKVSLLSASPSAEELLSTMTGEDGNFLLTPVKPGQYFVEASHERWHLSKKRSQVTVKGGNTVVPAGSLQVSGYDVSGSVTSDSEPIRGVSFVLFQPATAKRVNVIGCDSTTLTGFSPSGVELKDWVPICHVSSDTKGHFVFPSLSPGQYSVVPHYQGTTQNNIKFDVHPQQLTFQVKHSSLQLPTVFQVKGFSVDGKVSWSPNGRPLEGASVLIDSKVVTKTGKDGVFRLDSMTPGIYKLHLQAPDVQFEQQHVKVTPNTPHLGELVPSAYRVCGRVSVSQPGSSSAARVVHLETEGEQVGYTATTDNAGLYCTFLPVATYSVTLPVTDDERTKGLQFAPLKRTVRVVDGPVTGVDFSQLQATVRGAIKCLTSPCPDITVTLQSGPDSTTAVAKGGVYVFDNVLPGEYTVSVPSQDWCWEREEISLSVSTEKVTGPTFVQTGLPIHFVSSHFTKVHYKLEGDVNGTSQVMEVPAGESRVCVPSTGVWVLEPVGCHGYAGTVIRWTGGTISLTALTHLYTGRVTSLETVSDLIVNVIPSEDNASPSSVRKLGPITATPQSGAPGVDYVFSLPLAPGESVTLVPSASSLLFTPLSAVVVGANDCVQGVVFKAERGQVVEGRVLGGGQPVIGASVTIYNTAGELVGTQITDNEGRYIFGPLSANTKYNVTAEKEGYVMSGPNNKGEFSAHKLAEIIVTVRDKADGSPLQGVLLSLSGGENYRRNSQTSEDGTMAFLSLSPGEYFLRPMMKEYRFDPPSKMTAIKEGVTVEVMLSGERVAYSALGTVTSLSGDPEPGVVVEAVGQGSQQCSQLQEESSTETSGQFRIRGLNPQCEYSVRVKQGPQVNQHIQRATPDGILVKVSKEDVHGLNMIVFRPISRTDVSVYVTTESAEHLRSLKVKMFRDDTTVHTIRLSSLKPTASFALTSTALVFPPVPADGRTYSIQLESTLSPKTHNYKTHPVYFKANSSFQLVRLNFATSPRASDSELSHTSYFALPLVLVVLLIIYHRDTAKTLVTKVMESRLTTVDNQTDDSSTETLISDVSIKRKLKARKT
ncbi:BOS complex subunit NOMO2-like [Macrosteles quadrilineatus]|uniref:BOS complex subunit NOMO2-like n=1 Tax=Macrosteles quadrilineatus TaxID=74068 RepID=UPI0023E333C3|nr:BOS complex subunit NOMO2-like [Macrosteles quadrilineatus]